MPLYNASPKQLILDEINRLNNPPVKLTLGNTSFDVPEIINPPLADGSNTRIRIKAKQGHDIQGMYTHEYKRLDLSLLFLNTPLVIDQQGVTSTHGGLTNINLRYGLNFTPDDIVDLFVGANGPSVPFGAKAGSLQYIGGVRVTNVPRPNWLNLSVQDRLLDACFHFNNKPVNKLSGAMLNYAFDYTDESTVLKNVKAGLLESPENILSGAVATIRSALLANGIPAFDYTGSTVGVYSASMVKGGNTGSFSYVCVIDNITDPNVVGPIYLHYNDL